MLYSTPIKVAEMSLKSIPLSECMPFIQFEHSSSYSEAYSTSENASYSTAISLYKSLIFRSFTHFEVFNNIAVCYNYLNCFDKAEKYLKKAIRSKNTSFVPYYNLALLYLKLEKNQECIKVLDKAMIKIANPPKDLYKIREYCSARTNSCEIQKERQKFSGSRENSIIRRSSFRQSRTPKHLFMKYFDLERPFPEKVSQKSSSKSIRVPKPLSKEPYMLNRIRLVKRRNLSPQKLNQNDEQVLATSSSFIQHFSQIKFMENGLIQKEELNISPTEHLFGSTFQAKRAQSRINFIQYKLQEEMYADLDDIEPSPIKSVYLTEQNLEFIIDQYLQSPSLRDYAKIDKTLCGLAFFAKFPHKVRLYMYKIGKIGNYLAGKVIFHEGDVGDKIYTVLKGSVLVQKINPELMDMSLTVNSLYDGKQFGDISLMHESKVGRSATIICSEDSYFLEILKKDYQKILLDLQREEIEEKVDFFSGLNIFKGVSNSILSTLATNIELTTYNLNEVVINQGEIPKGLYVIYSGRAVLYTQGYRCNEKFGNKYSNIRKRKTDFSSPTRPCKSTKEEMSESIIKRVLYNDVSLTEHTSEIQRYVSLDKFKQAQKKENTCYIVKDWLEFASIQSKDYFGGRMILMNTADLASKFTIVAKSSVLKLFIIDRSHMHFLTEEAVHQVKTILTKSFEVDCPPEVDSESLKKTLVEWQLFRKNLLESIERDRYVDRNKIYFPFVR